MTTFLKRCGKNPLALLYSTSFVFVTFAKFVKIESRPATPGFTLFKHGTGICFISILQLVLGKQWFMGSDEQSSQQRAFVKGDTTFMRRPFQKLPLNLSEWVAPATLAAWVSDEVEKLDPAKAEAQQFQLEPPESQARELLRAVLYAYATQIYISEEIAAACRTDPILKALCEDKAPFPEELERFRRRHRSLLETLLGQILVRAVGEKFVNVGQLPPGFQNSLLRRAIDSIDTARHMDRNE
jgi:hypothetical protein